MSNLKLNSLTGLLDGLFSPGNNVQNQTISLQDTLVASVPYTLLTLNRPLLSYAYVGLGLVQTVIDLPVEDAFRGGIEIETDELDEQEIKQLYQFMEAQGDFTAIKGALKWARLFGGGGLVVDTNEDDMRGKFDPRKFKPEDVLRFLPADRWELTLTHTNIMDISQRGFLGRDLDPAESDFMYYGVPIHNSRMIKVNGKEAPSFIRARLQGWGMSEMERCLRSINSFVKFQNMIFEIVDEAKLDILKMQGFTSSLATDIGTELVRRRVELNAMMKNYKSTSVMDSEDEFDQKQLSLSGYAEVYAEIRQNLAGDLNIPEAKLFGQSSSGFSSGQDTIENYNAMVDSTIREPAKPVVRKVVDLRCQQLHGFVPEYQAGFKPLRVLSGPEQEQVNTAKVNNALSLYDRHLFTDKETLDSLDKDGLINMRTEIQDGTRTAAEAAQQAMEAEGVDPEEAKEKLNSLVAERKEFYRRDAYIMSLLDKKGKKNRA